MAWKLILKEKPRTSFQRNPDYALLLNGAPAGEIYYNMDGYVGALPVPGTTTKRVIGERALSAYKREIAALNREARSA